MIREVRGHERVEIDERQAIAAHEQEGPALLLELEV